MLTEPALMVSVEPAVYGNIGLNSGIAGTFSAFNDDGTKLLFARAAHL